MNHIELFAGCGGLSLGLEITGFNLVLANELSPMAAESFAYNILGEDLSAKDQSKEDRAKTFWLTSQYQELKLRLRENPFEYPADKNPFSDIPDDVSTLDGALLIGNIIQLNKLLDSNKALKKALRNGFGKGEIDLVSGGPPCQSFSLAGLREKNNEKNTLPWEFANFVDHIQPRFVILENVTGILRGFTEKKVIYHAWHEIAKVFASKGYIPLCLHVNARLVGVPQNRPRFIMLAVRLDVYNQIKPNLNESECKLFAPSEKLYKLISRKKSSRVSEYKYFDVTKTDELKLFKDSFLSSFIGSKEVSVKSAIEDLKFSGSSRKSAYVSSLNRKFEPILGKTSIIQNHEIRRNSDLVRRRFRIYQVIQNCAKDTQKQVIELLKGGEAGLNASAWKELKQYKFLSADGAMKLMNSKSAFEKYLANHPTKKRTQKALDKNTPAPAALSIPDDACHYDEDELRTLTVREMARIQSFPDSFEFRSKITTGGKMRRYEVPQYTQVGNAVPPLLGIAIGESIIKLCKKLEC